MTMAERMRKLVLACGLMVLTSCHWNDDFICGTRLDADGKARLCDAHTGEVCICATGGCARPDRSCTRETGVALRYLSRPYAPGDLAGGCVAKVEAPSAHDQAQPGSLLCEAKSNDAGTLTEDAGQP